MKDVIDIAAYILEKVGDVSTMKLQKLAFYSHAYCLVKFEKPLFSNRIEAWVNGPVVPDLFKVHRGKYVVNFESMEFPRTPIELDSHEKQCIEHVIGKIGELSGAELSQLTHSENPWRDARVGLKPKEQSERQISNEAIYMFYSSKSCPNCIFAAA